MSSTIEVGHHRRESALDTSEHALIASDVARTELERELAAQRERLRALRASVLARLSEQRKVVPRLPSGPKLVPTLVDEDEWWAKMLGQRRAA